MRRGSSWSTHDGWPEYRPVRARLLERRCQARAEELSPPGGASGESCRLKPTEGSTSSDEQYLRAIGGASVGIGLPPGRDHIHQVVFIGAADDPCPFRRCGPVLGCGPRVTSA